MALILGGLEIQAGVMLSTLLRAVFTILAARLAYFLYEGVSWRLKFRKMAAEGVPMLEHSLFYGSLPAWKKLQSFFPRDAGSFRVLPLYILDNWREVFPGEPECPPFFAVDVWPFASPSIFIWDPAQIHKFTVEKPLPREDTKFFMEPVTGGIDLLSVDMSAHREWRNKFSAAFSQRNLVSRIPTILEEVEIFVAKIRAKAGADGSWGDVFALEEPAIRLTLDVIGRFALDVRLGEQVSGKSAFRTALLKQIKEMSGPSPRTSAQRITPTWLYRTWRNHQAMNSVILPKLRSLIASPNENSQSTVIEHILHDHRDGGKKLSENSELIKGLISNIKAFAFAGHDTTATTICWCFYILWKHPKVLAKLQAEHEEVFGTDPKRLPDILSKSPHKINELPYTLAVLKETLRVYAIVHSFRKGDSSLELTTCRAKVNTKGFSLIVASAALHLHPSLWHRAREFIPERWLVPKDDLLYPPPHAWRPFEHGPLDCLGQGLAILELKLVLVRVLPEVEIAPSWEKWDLLQGKTEAQKTTVDGERAYPSSREAGLLKPKDGLPVHVRLRSPRDPDL